VSMSDPAPGTSPANLHSLVLVQSSGRSGARLLCQDLKSLGGLGMPKEYLRGIRPRTPTATASEVDVLERVAKGVQEDAPGVASVQLMVPQFPPTYQALRGKRIPAIEALPGVIDWAKERFERLFLIFLARNAIDQAISHVVADASGTLQSSDCEYGETGAEATALEIPHVNPLILANLGRVVRDRRILLESYGKFADIGLLLTYDELDREPAETATKLVGHARKNGFEVTHDVFQRKLERVVSGERFTEIREGFLDYLKRETGVEPSDLDGSARPFLELEAADE
jgi:LPS sulfotransferase NodH